VTSLVLDVNDSSIRMAHSLRKTPTCEGRGGRLPSCRDSCSTRSLQRRNRWSRTVTKRTGTPEAVTGISLKEPQFNPVTVENALARIKARLSDSGIRDSSHTTSVVDDKDPTSEAPPPSE
jgi:hypothetical protein